jgi:hypothetical protein
VNARKPATYESTLQTTDFADCSISVTSRPHHKTAVRSSRRQRGAAGHQPPGCTSTSTLKQTALHRFAMTSSALRLRVNASASPHWWPEFRQRPPGVAEDSDRALPCDVAEARKRRFRRSLASPSERLRARRVRRTPPPTGRRDLVDREGTDGRRRVFCSSCGCSSDGPRPGRLQVTADRAVSKHEARPTEARLALDGRPRAG